MPNFISTFQTNVTKEYLRVGSRLRNTVRVQTRHGNIAEFPFMGKEGASGKDAIVHLYDRSSDYQVNRPDLLLSSPYDMAEAVSAHVAGLGHVTDTCIVQALDESINFSGSPRHAMSENRVTKAKRRLRKGDAPTTGRCFGIIGWRQWMELMNHRAFKYAPIYTDPAFSQFATPAKVWRDIIWMPFMSLTKSDEGVRHCYLYHEAAVGHAIATRFKSSLIEVSDELPHRHVSTIVPQGATIIDPTGVVLIPCIEK